MSLFGAAPLDPRGPQAALAAAATNARAPDKQKPAVEANRRMRDALEQRVSAAESDAAVRDVVDRHEDEERKRDEHPPRRRDGREDSLELSAPPGECPEPETGTAAPNSRPRSARGRIDLTG